MTSLPPHYRDDGENLEAHLREEHAIFTALEAQNRGGGGGGGGAATGTKSEAAVFSSADASTGTRRAHLCCTNYQDGPALKKSLEADAGGKRFVRTALNSASRGGYCAIAHVSSATAASAAAAADLKDARCSPLTHASKEPLSLLEPASSGPWPNRGGNTAAAAGGAADGTPFFGLRLGPAVQSGSGRGLVVTLSPGSLPLDAAEAVPGVAAVAAAAAGNTRGGRGSGSASGSSSDGREARNRQLSSSEALEETWRAFWGEARGTEGAGVLAEAVPWTGSSAVPLSGIGESSSGGTGRGRGGRRRRGLLAGDGDNASWEALRSGGSRDNNGGVSRAREFHNGKAVGYEAALEHLGEKMEEGGEGGATLAETCGWDSNLVFVHSRDDLLYLRCVIGERVACRAGGRGGGGRVVVIAVLFYQESLSCVGVVCAASVWGCVRFPY